MACKEHFVLFPLGFQRTCIADILKIRTCFGRGLMHLHKVLAHLSHYQTTNFRLFQLKEFADGNFKFDENGRKLSKRVENTVGKGEIACYEQFSFSQIVFKRLVSQRRQKVSLCENGLSQHSLHSRWERGRLYWFHHFHLSVCPSVCPVIYFVSPPFLTNCFI